MDRLFGLFYTSAPEAYKVGILEAMRVLKRLWIALPPQNMQNCWEYTGISWGGPSVVWETFAVLYTYNRALSKQGQELVPEG